MNDSELYSNWYLSLLIAGVVIIIAATLLILLWMAARRIAKLAKETLDIVAEIKNNTKSIWVLKETNRIANSIQDGSEEIKNNSQNVVEILQHNKKQ